MPRAMLVARGLPALYALSGAAALILEVAWSRLLTLEVGHTTGATSTVLAAFMGGLAVGAALGGRFAERCDRRRALLAYAGLELIVAVSALALPFVLVAATPLLDLAYANGETPWRFGFARVVVSLAALAIPTIAMGATYPIVTRALAADSRHVESPAGWLYAANTLGAACGALLAGFLLLPALGTRATTLAAALLNVLAAAAAWWIAARIPWPQLASESETSPVGPDTREPGGGEQDESGRTRRRAAASTSARPAEPSARSWPGRGRGKAHGAAKEKKEKLRAHGVAQERTQLPAPAWLGLLAAGVAGLVALAYQVVWARVLALLVGPTTFAFSAMVGVFIAGLAAGAVLGTRLARGQGRRPATWLGMSMFAVAAATVVAMHLTSRLLLWMATASGSSSAFESIIWRQLAVAAALLGPLSVAFGAAFPLALAVAGARSGARARVNPGSGTSLAPGPGLYADADGDGDGDAGAAPTTSARAGPVGLTPTRLSLTYAINTTGAIAGALLAGFVLVPALGLQGTLRLGALVSLGSGALVLVLSQASSLRSIGATLTATAVLAAGVLTRGAWDPALLSSGGYRFSPTAPGAAPAGPGAGSAAWSARELQAALTAGDLLFYEEGPAGAVAVRRLAGTTSLVIDGKPDASNAGDMLTQKLLAHLPLLHHASPSRAAILGLGSGVTAGAALTHGLSGLDVVEISPEVVRASEWFRAENGDALRDRRTRLLVADGRSHLRLTDARYDVIISEPSNPWMAGVAALFTRELMSGVRERLAPGGIFCQWTHTYDMSPADLRSIVATLLDVFPHASLWLVGESDALLLGSMTPLTHDAATLAARFARPGIADDLRTVSVSRIDDLTGLRVADTAALRRYASGAPLQTDDRMSLEFSAPRSLVAHSGRENVAQLLALAPTPAAPAPAATRGDGTATDGRRATDGATAGAGGIVAALPATASATNPGADAARWSSRGRMLLRAEAYGLAFAALTRAVALAPADEAALEALARAAGGAGRVELAVAQLRGLLDADSSNHVVRAALARLLAARGDVDGALAVLAASTPPSPAPVPAPVTSASASGSRSASARASASARDGRAGGASPLATAPAAAADTRVLRAFASIFADAGDTERLGPVVDRLQREIPDHPDTQYYAASLAFLQGRLDDAVQQARRLVTSHPSEARALNLIGAALATQGRADEARVAFAHARAADPRDTGAYINGGLLELDQANASAARGLFAAALALDPTNQSAREGLARALASSST